MNIREFLHGKVQQAMTAAGIAPEFSAQVALAKKAGFGDYQANGAMGAAKTLKTNPRALAQTIVEHLDLSGIAAKVEVAGPGFINIHLLPRWLATQATAALSSHKLGLSADEPQTIVVDYSAPNLAKEMHVGHLRSTIIGDAIARILEFLGHRVIRQNHVGDWGTQFGMLIAELERHLGAGEQAGIALHDLESFYQQAKRRFDEDAEFADLARNYVVRLQSGDSDILRLWTQFREISLQHSEDIYKQLNISLQREHVHGESAYNSDLPVLVKDLRDKDLAVEDQGATVMFLAELADKDGNPCPMIVQKQDGGYLYATTDLAAIRYRVGTLQAKRIVIFTDARQALHMQQVYTAARKAGYIDPSVSMEHHTFGTMMGADGKPFKTRTGDTIKLNKLLTEAVERAAALIAQKNPDLSAQERKTVARKVGIGAIKYADLSKTRTHNYLFNWNAMLSFEGNTAPYLQYAYIRVQGIFRKANVSAQALSQDIQLQAPQEIALALKALQFSEAIEQVARDAFPHILCTYLYELSSLYMSFYEACPILKQDVDKDTRNSRLQLCHLVAKTLHIGLDLLGIETMEQM